MGLNSGERVVPADFAAVITPDDANDLANATRGIYVGVGGDLKVTMIGGDTVSFVGLAGGSVYPFRVKKVFATGQPGAIATSLVALY